MKKEFLAKMSSRRDNVFSDDESDEDIGEYDWMEESVNTINTKDSVVKVKPLDNFKY